MTSPIPLPRPKLDVASSLPSSSDAVVVAVAAKDDAIVLLSPEDALGPNTRAAFGTLIESGDLRGKASDAILVATADEVSPLIVAGWLGDAERVDRVAVFDWAASAIRKLLTRPRKRVTFLIGDAFDPAWHDAVVAGALSGCEGQHLYQRDSGKHVPESLCFVGVSREAVQRGEIIGTSVNQTRRLVNEPPTIMNPTEFARRAASMAKDVGLGCEVWDEKRLADERCRAILAVGAGSASPPRLVILKHDGGGDEAPLAIVGKGVTFDSGGLSLKPSEGMVDMKCDMAGAATVFGVMQAIAQMGLKKNVIGLCGLAENMVSGTSYKLGDVIETRSGKTIEILNTDAEGRVVLADTLNVAVEHQPASIIDLATLTGACMVALGNEVVGMMANDEGLCDEIRVAANQEGEPVWQLPMYALYDDKVKSKVADIRNIGEGRWGGAITAAKFLENFVDEVPWVHLDIAGPAFTDSAVPQRDAGASGVMVRTLIRWLTS
ncbi:MAG: leucyl aminopeptidase [Planctomycetota bacterium]